MDITPELRDELDRTGAALLEQAQTHRRWMGAAPKRLPVLGPRTLIRREAYRLRKALLDSGRKTNLTVLAVQQQTRLNERDRAERRKGGPGNATPLTREQRMERYRRGGRPLTNRQARQVLRKNAFPELRAITGKGQPTPKRLPMLLAWLGWGAR